MYGCGGVVTKSVRAISSYAIQHHEKVYAGIVGSGIGLGYAIDEAGDYISRKRNFRDFSKP